MGVVYEAHDPELDRRVAIKVLRRRRHERLLREARALASVSHPNVVSVSDVGSADGRLWLAMEFIDGEPLRKIASRRLSWREQLEIMLAAGRGLAAVHAAGLVHRDVKPDNIMVVLDAHGRPSRVALMDLGLVLARGESSSGSDVLTPPQAERLTGDRLTRTGAMLGTPAYMAPEQHAGLDADARSDQFSFCVTAHEVLHGRRPFDGSTAAELWFNQSQGRIQGARRHDLPGWVDRILARGMRPDPDKRWASMDDLLVALERKARRRPRRLVWLGIATAAIGIAAMSPPPAPVQSATVVEQWPERRVDPVELAELRRELGEAKDVDAVRVVLARAQQMRHEPSVASAHIAIGRLLQRGSKTDEALAAFEEAASVAESAGSQRLIAKASLGLAHVAARDALELDRAERAARQARAALDRHSDAELECEWLGVNGMIAHRKGELAQAVGWMQRTVDCRARVFGPRSVNYGEGLVGLGAMLGAQHREDEAAVVFRAALDVLEEQLGGDDERLGAPLHNLGGILTTRGDFAEAEVLLRRVLKIDERAYGPEHPAVASDLDALGDLFTAQGRYDEAHALLTRAVGINLATRGAEHPATAYAFLSLADLHAITGRYDDAERAYVRAMVQDQSCYAAATLGLETVRLRRGAPNAGPQLLAALEKARDLLTPEQFGQRTIFALEAWLHAG